MVVNFICLLDHFEKKTQCNWEEIYDVNIYIININSPSVKRFGAKRERRQLQKVILKLGSKEMNFV
jgi:hypothetical protein